MAQGWTDFETDHNKEIEEHIRDICERKDAEALEDWRGFYKRKLIGLDKSALEIIQKNSHLIHDDDSRVTLRNFLKAVAKQGMALNFWLLNKGYLGNIELRIHNRNMERRG